MKELLEAALNYAAQGQPVFPCWESGPKAKAPRTRNGLKDATSEAEQIINWWAASPGAAIGLPTGMHYDVIDVDVKKDINGHATYERLRELLGLVPEYVVSTPSGGTHYYFPADKPMRNYSFGRLGIDIRGIGGYVIAPPSTSYRLHRANSHSSALNQLHLIGALRDMQAENQPPAAKRASSGRSKGATNPEGIILRLLERKEGERNAYLFWAACRFYEDDLDVSPLILAAVSIGLDVEEIGRTIASAKKRVEQEANDNDGRNR